MLAFLHYWKYFLFSEVFGCGLFFLRYCYEIQIYTDHKLTCNAVCHMLMKCVEEVMHYGSVLGKDFPRFLSQWMGGRKQALQM